jgi:UPF0506
MSAFILGLTTLLTTLIAGCGGDPFTAIDPAGQDAGVPGNADARDTPWEEAAASSDATGDERQSTEVGADAPEESPPDAGADVPCLDVGATCMTDEQCCMHACFWNMSQSRYACR